MNEKKAQSVPVLDIVSRNAYPSSALSNFAPDRFELDGVVCHSREGVIQALKFSDPCDQAEVCALQGLAAKMAGKKRGWTWQKTGLLYWNGQSIRRHAVEYQLFLDRLYLACFEQSEWFRTALKATGDAILTHRIGEKNPRLTLLTEDEFCSRLMKLRGLL